MSGPCFASNDTSQVVSAWILVALCAFTTWGGIHLIRFSGREDPIAKAEGPVRLRTGIGVLIVSVLFAAFILGCLFFGRP